MTMKKLSKKFQGLYWRQLFVTAGMVMLTLFLLGASFFSLSYNYARGQKSEELAAKAQVVAQLCASYLENGGFQDEKDLKELASAHGDQFLRHRESPVIAHNPTDKASPKKHIRPL